MLRVLEIEPWSVATFGLFVWLGAFAGLLWTWRESERLGLDRKRVTDEALFTLLGALVGGRATYVAFNWGDYAADFRRISTFWGGGLSFPGAFVGGLLALVLLRCQRAFPLWVLADLMTQGLALGQVFGWTGALLHGSQYGQPVDSPLSPKLPDIYGIIEPRLPVQIAGALCALLLFILLRATKRRYPVPGVTTGLYATLYGGALFCLGFLRGDEANLIGPLRTDQWGYLVMINLGLAIWGLRLRYHGP